VRNDGRRPGSDQQGPARSLPRRDRRGRGVRSELAPAAVPRSRSRSERFDEFILDAISELETHWAAELDGVEFAVEDVPSVAPADVDVYDPSFVVDRGVPLGRLLREGVAETTSPTIVIFRRPIEARAVDGEDRADLVFMIVAELVAELLGRDVDEINPPRH
jgi:hypothetical protein